jgi:hypothetical protein
MGPLLQRPSRAVESLPWDVGGAQRADIPAQMHAQSGRGGGDALASPATGLEDAHATGISAVPACPGTCSAGQHPATSVCGTARPQAGRWSTGSALFVGLGPHWLLAPDSIPLHTSNSRSGLLATAASLAVVRRVGCRCWRGGWKRWDQQWQALAAWLLGGSTWHTGWLMCLRAG